MRSKHNLNYSKRCRKINYFVQYSLIAPYDDKFSNSFMITLLEEWYWNALIFLRSYHDIIALVSGLKFNQLTKLAASSFSQSAISNRLKYEKICLPTSSVNVCDKIKYQNNWQGLVQQLLHVQENCNR